MMLGLDEDDGTELIFFIIFKRAKSTQYHRDRIELEDLTGFILLEDGSGFILQG